MHAHAEPRKQPVVPSTFHLPQEAAINRKPVSVDGKSFADVSLEDLLPRVGLRQYLLIRLAMVRALEIHHGSPPLVPHHSAEKATTIALREIAQGRVGTNTGPAGTNADSTESETKEPNHG
ncbi:MAG: DNA-directed RNA polymerase subunit omega [Candidatus Omnitrophica bacterium]|nr:DNA-directed RNA polymerase subunit omega [Candidatus Omnitrophota bacterium]MCB9719939.1 DNA-directed RNA polymerase subunit omega [Candidatus Omnitrophota bacterium]